MSAPYTNYDDPIRGAMQEACSAMSALNMHPDPLAKPEGDYLSERDGWAKHAVEHIRAVFDLLDRAYAERDRIRAINFRLEVRMREMEESPHRGGR